MNLFAAFDDAERRRFLALLGRLPADAGDVARRLAGLPPEAILCAVQHDPGALTRLWQTVGAGPYPGRAEALLRVARALGRPLPASEYVLPEQTLESLLERARQIAGARVPVRGKAQHKGRVGDGVERLLLGAKAAGRGADHAAAEIKSVPVRGDKVIERVKLGVVHPQHNPLDKCGTVLFVFVEQRGADHFVRGHRLHEFVDADWSTMWQDHFLVETAAGSPQRPARGLYLTPSWFYRTGLWP